MKPSSASRRDDVAWEYLCSAFLGCCDPNIVGRMESNRKKMMTSFLVPDYVPFLFVCSFLIVFNNCRAEPILNLNATEPKNRISILLRKRVFKFGSEYRQSTSGNRQLPKFGFRRSS